MKPEWKQRWADALRSGKYQQGRHYLQKDGKFCCLGVLCDLLDPTGWQDSTDNVAFPGVRFFSESTAPEIRFSGRLPYTILSRVGLTPHEMDELMFRNDGTYSWRFHPQTFDEIATYIDSLPNDRNPELAAAV